MVYLDGWGRIFVIGPDTPKDEILKMTTPPKWGVYRSWKTRSGKRLRFEHLDQDPDDMKGVNKGYVVRKVNAYVGSEPLGYLKISYVPSNRVSECFPTVWHWVEAMKGWCFDIEDLADSWRKCHHYAMKVPKSLVNTGVRSNGLAGHEPDVETMQADMDALENHYVYSFGMTPRELFEEFVRDRVDYAFVDYIRVSEDWLRQGIGTALYNEGARWLAERFRLPLHGSGLQTPEAAAAWKKMGEDETMPTRIHKRRTDGREIPVLDYL